MTEDDGILYIDNSTLKAEGRCSTEVMLRYAYHYTTAEERATLRAGTAFHKLAEVHFRGGSPEEALAAFDEEYRDWALANVPVFDRLAYDNLIRIVSRWIEVHPLSALPFTIQPDLVEIGFAFPLTDDGDIVLCGRLDGLPTYQDDLYVLENKTTGKVNSDWLDGFSLDSQLTGYIWAAQQHTGRKVPGAFLNAVQFDKLPGGITPTGKSPQRCKEHGVLQSECGGLHATFRLVLVERTPEAIAEWKKTAIHLARRFRDRLTTHPTLEALHRLRMQGTFNGSCRWCGFKPFCKMGRPYDYINANMVYERWSPYDRTTEAALPTAKLP